MKILDITSIGIAARAAVFAFNGSAAAQTYIVGTVAQQHGFGDGLGWW